MPFFLVQIQRLSSLNGTVRAFVAMFRKRVKLRFLKVVSLILHACMPLRISLSFGTRARGIQPEGKLLL